MLRFVKFHLGWSGRLNRLSYFILSLVCYITALVLLFSSTVLDEVSVVLLEEYDMVSEGYEKIANIIAAPLGILAIIFLWVIFTSTIKRLHDMNKSGKWLTFPLFLPMPVNIILIASQQFLLLIALKAIGTLMLLLGIVALLFGAVKGENRFGPDPRNEKLTDVLSGKFHYN